MNIDKSLKQEDEKIFKQRLQRVHAVTGITFSLFMYISLFFGIFAILLPFIQNWEKPSRHYKMPDITQINYNSLIEPILSDPNYPKINPIIITLPGNMQDPSLKISTDFVETIVINPNTNTMFIDDEKISNLAMFLNHIHYGKPFGEFGLYTFGFVAVGVLFLVIGGVLLVLKIKYKNNTNSKVGIFSKYHRKIFIWTFAPFIIITLTGAMFNLGLKNSGLMTTIVSKGEASHHSQIAYPYLFPKPTMNKLNNEKATMLPISELIKKAQEIAPQVDYQKIKIINYGDTSALFILEGYNPYMPFLNGISNKPHVVLSGIDGKLIYQQKVLDRHWSAIFLDAILFLHFLFGVDIFTRLFIVILMLLSTFSVGFGVLLYLEKKSRKFPKDVEIYQGFGKLSLAVMIGVIPATGFIFTLQWLLPFDIENRFLIQKGLFAIFWCAILTYCFYKINSYQTTKDLLYIGGFLFIISTIIHFINSGFSPIDLYLNEMNTILIVDIGLFLFGLILIFIAKKIPTSTDKIQKFWLKRGLN